MPLEITSREQEGIQILELKGRLTFGQEDLDLRNELDSWMRTGKTRVVLNLEAVSELDSTGVGTLQFAASELQKAGGGLAIVHSNPNHIELLVEANLSIFKDDVDAVNSFFPGREVQHYDILEFVRSKLRKTD